EGKKHRRRIQRPTSEQNVERATAKRAQQRRVGHASPEMLEPRSRALGSAFGIAIDQHGGVHRPGRWPRNALEAQPGLLEQAIEHAPSEGAVGPAPLKRKINEKGSSVHRS